MRRSPVVLLSLLYVVTDQRSTGIGGNNCTQGDQPGIVWKNYTCEQMVIKEPAMCYDAIRNRRCCLYCEEIKQQDAGCEYGDKSSWCQTHLVVPTGCYKNEDLCCSTCKLAKDLTKLSYCRYGDKHASCDKLRIPIGCYWNSDVCCGTCANYFKPENVGCEYGDKDESCKDLNYPGTCFYNARTCCESCLKHKDHIAPGCVSGDWSWACRTMDRAKCPDNRIQCCKTCALEND